MVVAARFSWVAVAARVSPDSAGDKNAITNIIASQQVRRAPAFDRFTPGILAHDVDGSRKLVSNPGRNVAVSSWAVSDFMVLLLFLRASVADFLLNTSTTN